MTRISSCPVEILHNILTFLPAPDLKAVCLTNSHLRAVAQPVLYTSISIELPSIKKGIPTISYLISTLLRRRDLAAHVSTLKLNGNHLGMHFSYSNPHLPQFFAYIKTLHLHYHNVWISFLQKGWADPFMALLLAQLPNLQSLHLDSDSIKELQVTGELLKVALCDNNTDLPTFPHLRTVSFRPSHTIPGKPLTYHTPPNNPTALPLFYLPSLQTLHARIDPPRKLIWPAPSPPTCTHLTTLHLEHIREGGPLGSILSATKNLRTLRWDIWYDAAARDSPELRSERVSSPIINLDRIGSNLFRVSKTLEKLTITAECEADDLGLYRGVSTRGSLKKLRGMKRLVEVEVPLVLLVGIAASPGVRMEMGLPECVERVVVTDDLEVLEEFGWTDGMVFGMVEAWMGEWRVSTPRLKGVKFWLREMSEGFGPLLRERLAEVFAREGVELEIVKENVDGGLGEW
ncbi:hypothetical protein QBC34DRAFT_461027 [Podospora aff. communis PSN243]|uniref:F-box domain-containing protein n=1 Tax=Podospora aff. communis PSN243 TaxID=3040156 RepID=A0AAV9GVA4_9PEZI|nr:hypothetical protein QBC34DRAFT_461027 [Podospora aff. communis PSN243]